MHFFWQKICAFQLKYISWKFVPKDPIDNKSPLVGVMAWCQLGNTLLTQSMNDDPNSHNLIDLHTALSHTTKLHTTLWLGGVLLVVCRAARLCRGYMYGWRTQPCSTPPNCRVVCSSVVCYRVVCRAARLSRGSPMNNMSISQIKCEHHLMCFYRSLQCMKRSAMTRSLTKLDAYVFHYKFKWLTAILR